MNRIWQSLLQRSSEARADARGDAPSSLTNATFAVPLMIAPGVAELRVWVDASTRHKKVTGLGLVIRDGRDVLIGWHARTARGMTNNEGEYESLLFGLATVLPYRPQNLRVFADSQVVVDQMNGASTVRSGRLQPLYQRAQRLAKQLAMVSFTHIPREWNVLADAMAEDAVLRATGEMRG
jgi:ribonuclease HI